MVSNLYARADVQGAKRSGLELDIDRVSRDGFAALTPDDLYRLKTYGVCSQNVEAHHMLRVRVRHGSLTSTQARRSADVASMGDGTCHLTTRCSVELHMVPTLCLADALTALDDVDLTTRSACGHTFRNVLASPCAGVCADEVVDVRPFVEAVHVWVIEHSAYQNSRLPSRLNVSLAGCPEAAANALVNDIGFVAVGDEAPGFALFAGGSLGAQPRLSEMVSSSVAPEDVVVAVETVADIYHTDGYFDRPGAKARLKYLIADRGIEWFRTEFARRFADKTGRQPAPPDEGRGLGDHAPVLGGVVAQRQAGFVRVRVRVPLGDLPAPSMRGLADLAEAYGDGTLRLTPQQNVEIQFVPEDRATEVTVALGALGLGVEGAGDAGDVRACVGTRHCVLAKSDSQAFADTIGRAVSDTPELRGISIHVSGCPNSCAQHQASDIGFGGRRVRFGGQVREGFEVYCGGRLGSQPRVADAIGNIPADLGPATVETLAKGWRNGRYDGEPFTAWAERFGRERLRELLAAALLEHGYDLEGAR